MTYFMILVVTHSDSGLTDGHVAWLYQWIRLFIEQKILVNSK